MMIGHREDTSIVKNRKILYIMVFILEILLIVFSCSNVAKHNNDESILIEADQLGYAADPIGGEECERGSDGPRMSGSLDTGINRRLVTPRYHLYPGVYQADIFYNTDIPIGSMIGANIAAYDDKTYTSIKSESAFLSARSTHTSFYIYVYGETDALLRLIMDDENTSDIAVDQITISRLASRSVLPRVINLLLLFSIIDACLLLITFKKNFLETNGLAIFVLLVIAILSSTPLFAGSLLKGYDMRFHYYRAYALAEGIRSGHFPVYIYPEYANNYGYAVGIFYPDTFLYIPALLYLIGYRLETGYMFLMFISNLATTLIAFYSFKKISKSVHCGIVGTAIYSMALPRLVALYTRGALRAALAYAFAPLLALGLIEMLRAENDEDRLAWLHVSISMSGILASHLLGSIMAVIFSLVFAIINMRRICKKKVIVNIVKSIIGTALLSAYYIVPFVDGMLHIEINSDANATPILNYAAYPAQLFTSKFNIIGDVSEDPTGMLRDMPMTLGLATLGVLLTVIAFAICGLLKKEDTQLLPVSIIFVLGTWMSTTFFPYKWLSLHVKTIYNFLTKFQFAYRFLAVGVLASAVIVVMAYANLKTRPTVKDTLLVITVVAFVLQGTIYLNAYANEMLPFEFSDSYRELDVSALYTKEYLPNGFNVSDIKKVAYSEELESNGGYCNILSESGTEIQVEISNPSSNGIDVTFPRIYYWGYIAKVNSTFLETKRTENGKTAVTIPAGLNGTVSLEYMPKGSWIAANTVSLLFAIILIAWLLKTYCNFKLPIGEKQ